MDRSQIGKVGENFACEYLKSEGYTIIERNYRKKWGELDIIAHDKQGGLIFVEVKTMKNLGNIQSLTDLQPEDNLTRAKLNKLQRTASLYAGNHSELINENGGWRIDLIAITISANANPQIKHYKNIE